MHLKYLYYSYPYLEFHYLPQHVCQILPQPTETPLQHNTYHVHHRFLYFVIPHLTTHYYKHWIYQTMSQVKPIKCIFKLYTDHNILWGKHTTHQKADSLRVTSLSKLENTVNNNNSIFNTKYAGFYTKRQVLIHFHNLTCTYNHH